MENYLIPMRKYTSHGLLISKLPNDIFLGESLTRSYNKGSAWKNCEDKDAGKNMTKDSFCQHLILKRAPELMAYLFLIASPNTDILFQTGNS